MHTSRRGWLLGLMAAASLLAGCSHGINPAASAAREALAPSGTLRIGVYPGSPTSMVTDKAGKPAGIAYELGQEFARRLQAPYEIKQYSRIAEVITAMQAGQVDFTFTNATQARSQILDFTPILLRLELGFLVPPASGLQTAKDMERPGLKIAVMKGGTTASVLGNIYRLAKIVEVGSPQEAAQALKEGKADAFTTNKGILFDLADKTPGARVLDGRWGLENMAAGVPKGRSAGNAFLQDFAQSIQSDGTLKQVIQRSGIRGFAQPD